MKKRNFSALVVVFAVCIVILDGCKEVGPVLPWGNTYALSDTSYTETPVSPETKNVLIEMFTGVGCINCPSAHITLDNIISTDSPRVIGIAMHSISEPNAQDYPQPGGLQNLGSTDAQSIITNFHDPGERPIGSVDRIFHSGSQTGSASIYDLQGTWSQYAQAQMALTTPVNMILSNTYTAATKTMTIAVELHYNSSSTTQDSDKLSIFLTEDSIVTAQLNGSVEDTFYVHNGIMRAALTNALGDNVNVSSAKGNVTRRIYQYTIPSAGSIWRPQFMHIVAFVHKYQNGASDILQTKIIPLVH